MANAPLSNWNSGRKGIILSLDGAVALVITLLILGASLYYMQQASSSSLPRLQMARLGADTAAVLDQEGTLDRLISVTPLSQAGEDLEEEIADLLPASYGMRIRVNGTFPGGEFSTPTPLPANADITSGSRVVVFVNDTTRYFASATYWIWLT